MSRIKSSVQECLLRTCSKHHIHIPTTKGEVLLVRSGRRGTGYLFTGPVGGNLSALVEGRRDLRLLRDALNEVLGDAGERRSHE